MQATDNLEKLRQRLDKLGISYEIIEHKPIATVKEGLEELGIEEAEGVSTLIMKADEKYISIIRRDDKKLSFKKIKKLLKVSDLRFAEREKVKELTNCDIGYVSLLNDGFTPLFDESILEREFIWGGTGSPQHDLKVKPQDLVAVTNAQVADITD